MPISRCASPFFMSTNSLFSCPLRTLRSQLNRERAPGPCIMEDSLALNAQKQFRLYPLRMHDTLTLTVHKQCRLYPLRTKSRRQHSLKSEAGVERVHCGHHELTSQCVPPQPWTAMACLKPSATSGGYGMTSVLWAMASSSPMPHGACAPPPPVVHLLYAESRCATS